MIFEALVGGGLIGLSATILLLFLGRIAGISGAVEGLLSHSFTKKSKLRKPTWQHLFIIGIILGSLLATLVFGIPFEIRENFSPLLLAASGLLVGYGTQLGNGCTSGHGICGIARFSLRSIIATITFMAFAAVTVFVNLHVFGGG